MTSQTLTNGTTRTDYSTKETAQFIRAALKAAFPGVKFSVRTSYASMTSSTHIGWTDGPTEPEVERVTNQFTSRGFDGMTDCTTFHEQTFNGERVKFSGWVTTHHRLGRTAAEGARPLQHQTGGVGYGPTDLTVQDGPFSAHLVGLDSSRANPCGGSATWCPDAVYQIAYKMRPNGVLITLKERFV